MRALLCLALAVACTGERAHAQAPTTTLRGQDAVNVAVPLLISAGQIDEALVILNSLSAEEAAQPGNRLLLAQIRRAQGKPFEAIAIYQALLSERSDLARFRLELAQTFFEVGDDRAAERHFRLALTGDIADADRLQAQKYLEQIALRARWRFQLRLAAAPSTNVNGATDAREIELFGLPFTLSEEARRSSGVNVNLSASADRSFGLFSRVRLRTTALASISHVPDHDLDYGEAEVRLGPQLTDRQRLVSVQASWRQSTFAGRDYASGPGVHLDSGAPIARNTTLDVVADVRRVQYADIPSRNGVTIEIGAAPTKYLSPQSSLRSVLAVERHDAKARSESYRSASLSLEYARTLPKGFAAQVGATALIRRYDGADPLFVKTREDKLAAVNVRLAQRHFSVAGFVPYVGGEFLKNESSLAFYAFQRTRFEAGLSRSF